MAASPDPEPQPPVALGNIGILLLGIWHLVASILVIYMLIAATPRDMGAPTAVKPTPVWLLPGHMVLMTVEERLVLFVVLMGGLGSFVQSSTSYVTYVGNRTIGRSWVWWYLLRMPIGAALALMFYMLMRGGLLSPTVSGYQINLYGIGAVSGLAGMFSKQATDKLREVFDTLFRLKPGRGDEERSDGLDTDAQTQPKDVHPK